MKLEELTTPLGLEPKHVRSEKRNVPIIDSHLYTTLGRQLFELYETYKISATDQRQIERLSYLLISFTLAPAKPKKIWHRIKDKLHGSKQKKRTQRKL